MLKEGKVSAIHKRCIERIYGHEFDKVWDPPPTTWTIFQQDGPSHLGLRYNALPEHQMARITSDCARPSGDHLAAVQVPGRCDPNHPGECAPPPSCCAPAAFLLPFCCAPAAFLSKTAPSRCGPSYQERLKQKNDEWVRLRIDYAHDWKKTMASTFYKALDHRSFYFKQVLPSPPPPPPPSSSSL